MTFYLLASITSTGISGTPQILAARLGQLSHDLPRFATEPVNTVRPKAMIANLRVPIHPDEDSAISALYCSIRAMT
jgi:hypothetical protein